MDIARGVEASLAPSNDRETDEHGGLFALAVQEGCSGDIGEVTIRGENAVSTATAGMDDTFGHLERVLVRMASRKRLCHHTRSWSKRWIFWRKMKSSSRVGPRSPTLRLSWSEMGPPTSVVMKASLSCR